MSQELNYRDAEDVGQRLRAWRSAAHLTLDEMMLLMYAALPRSHVLGRETLRRYEAGKVGPRQMETLILAVYASGCGRSLEELGAGFVHDLERIHRLVLKCAHGTT